MIYDEEDQLWYLNDFHRRSSKATAKEVASWKNQPPLSREEVMEQVQRFKSSTASKES